MKKKKTYRNDINTYLKRWEIGISNKDFIRIQSCFTSYPYQEVNLSWYKQKEIWKDTKTTLN